MARPRSKPARSAAPAPAAPPAFVHASLLPALAIVTLVAAAARLVALGSVPPGLNQDEALGAFNAWCLLKTGRALSGEVWPLFQCRNIGDHPTMLYFWLLMPFQWLGGLNAWTTRLPVALAGVLTVPLLHFTGARLFRPWVGLVAAAMFALAPWTVLVGRYGLGAGLTPLQALLPVAALLLAGYPLGDGEARPVRPAWAFAAGVFAGSAGYGFHSMRLYMPLLLAGLALVTPGALRAWAREARGRVALALLALGFAITFGPLAWASLTDPGMSARWEMTRLWAPSDSLAVRVLLVAQRWLEHFGPGFLFVHGDPFPGFAPVGQGELGWYVLPGLVVGAAFAIAAARRSNAARTLLVLVALYPAGDVVSRYFGPHLLRSALGTPALALLAAYGAVELVRRAFAWSAFAGIALAGLLATAGLAQDGLHMERLFSTYAHDERVLLENQSALWDAARALKPKFAEADAIFCTTSDTNQPWVVLLAGLEYDPRRWFADVKQVERKEFDLYHRVGKMRFIYGPDAQRDIEALKANGRTDDVLFLVRPHEFGFSEPLERYRMPDGSEALWLCRLRF